MLFLYPLLSLVNHMHLYNKLAMGKPELLSWTIKMQDRPSNRILCRLSYSGLYCCLITNVLWPCLCSSSKHLEERQKTTLTKAIMLTQISFPWFNATLLLKAQKHTCMMKAVNILDEKIATKMYLVWSSITITESKHGRLCIFQRHNTERFTNNTKHILQREALSWMWSMVHQILLLCRTMSPHVWQHNQMKNCSQKCGNDAKLAKDLAKQAKSSKMSLEPS